MRNIFFLLNITIFFAISCKKKAEPAQPPVAAILVSPAANSACLVGAAGNGNQATVTFNWNTAANTENYDLVVKELISGTVSTYSTTAITKDVALTTNLPYKWYVVSKNSKTTVTETSLSNKFFLTGTPASNYAPFPATLISPTTSLSSFGANTLSVNFQWDASDIDNDISYYNIYLDEANATTKAASNIVAKTTPLSLSSGKIYYWRVETIDKSGNSSMSEIVRFSIVP